MAELTSLPDGGRFVVAHVRAAAVARRYAEREGVDYVLTPHIEYGRVLILDMTQIERKLKAHAREP
jgi:stage V sporulation protein SpoVS